MARLTDGNAVGQSDFGLAIATVPGPAFAPLDTVLENAQIMPPPSSARRRGPGHADDSLGMRVSALALGEGHARLL
jgi:hypothetical protein